MKMRRRDKDTQGLADLEYLIEGGIRGAPTELTPGPEMYVPVVDELQSVMDAKESGVSALAALKEGNFGAAGLDGLMAMLAAAGAVPVVGRVPATIGKAIKKQKDRDYPDTNLGSRLSYEKQIQFLEDHGFSLLTDNKNKNFTYDIVDDKIITYSPVGGKGHKTKISRKTFKNPTLKQMRKWMGYKKGGAIVERNPYNYTAKAI